MLTTHDLRITIDNPIGVGRHLLQVIGGQIHCDTAEFKNSASPRRFVEQRHVRDRFGELPICGWADAAQYRHDDLVTDERFGRQELRHQRFDGSGGTARFVEPTSLMPLNVRCSVFVIQNLTIFSCSSGSLSAINPWLPTTISAADSVNPTRGRASDSCGIHG